MLLKRLVASATMGIRGLKVTAKFTATLGVATYSWREPISIALLISVVEDALER
jgi:hypothetical protein